MWDRSKTRIYGTKEEIEMWRTKTKIYGDDDRLWYVFIGIMLAALGYVTYKIMKHGSTIPKQETWETSYWW